MQIGVLTILASIALGLIAAAHRLRVNSRLNSQKALDEIGDARRRGSHKAQLQVPFIDLTRCIGCGSCVAACPEDQVLAILHGQAKVVHGARCVGHARCAEACPVEAIAVTIDDAENRRDLPALNEDLGAVNVPGLFLAGEVTGHALVKNATGQGITAGKAVASYLRNAAPSRQTGEEQPYDLCIVGVGPAGLACALQAKSENLHFIAIDREDVGGAVARYPRRKLVMTEPVKLPLEGSLQGSLKSAVRNAEIVKEDLVDAWLEIAERHDLPIVTGVTLNSLAQAPDNTFILQTDGAPIRTRTVVLALGRRGTPRKLGVPGEELAKVTYQLLEAAAYQHRRLLVVGGGDSAVESAVTLSRQPGNHVTLSYRKSDFFRIKSRNERSLQEAKHAGQLTVLTESVIKEIQPTRVKIMTNAGSRWIANDEVFVFAGGIPPFQLLEQCGVSFDPADRPAPRATLEQGPGLRRALLAGAISALLTLLWVGLYWRYYSLGEVERFASELHQFLRPSGTAGLAFGIAACVLLLVNLSYLIRRSTIGRSIPGTLRNWMSCHLLTGICALLFASLHAALAPRATLGGRAWIAMLVVVLAGVIGRYLYAFVPRAANGQESTRAQALAQLNEITRSQANLSSLGARMQKDILSLTRGQWRNAFHQRLLSLVASRLRFTRQARSWKALALELGVQKSEYEVLRETTWRAFRATVMAHHFEEVRALLASWRYLHRWLALLLLLLVALHIRVALRYANLGPALNPLQEATLKQAGRDQ